MRTTWRGKQLADLTDEELEEAIAFVVDKKTEPTLLPSCWFDAEIELYHEHHTRRLKREGN